MNNKQSSNLKNPHNIEFQKLLQLYHNKKYDDAERYYATGLEINPKHAGILSYQGELYLETGRLDMAKENLVKLNEYCNFNCEERNDLRDAINKKIESVY